jgi:hypothetical protein
VTIYGESAGAGSVLQHLVAHGGHTEPPLFRAAMLSSTFLPYQFKFDDPTPEVSRNQIVPCVESESYKLAGNLRNGFKPSRVGLFNGYVPAVLFTSDQLSRHTGQSVLSALCRRSLACQCWHCRCPHQLQRHLHVCSNYRRRFYR